MARDIGISAPGLALFLDGSVPRESTLRKIRDWYFSEAATHTEVSEAMARAALTVLLEPMPEEKRGRLFQKIVEILLEAHRKQGTVPPKWLQALDGRSDAAPPDAGGGEAGPDPPPPETGGDGSDPAPPEGGAEGGGGPDPPAKG